GVVFPQHKQGVGVFGKFGQQSQGCTFLVGKDRGRTGGVKRHADHVGSNRGIAFCKSFFNSTFQTFDVILWVLTVLVGRRLTIQTFGPTWIVLYGSTLFGSRYRVYNVGAARVGTVIQSDDVFTHGLTKGFV